MRGIIRQTSWGIVLVCVLLLTGCQSATDAVPKVRLGEDPCANCGMLINDARYACVIQDEEGEYHKYDDFNCMFLHAASGRIQPKRYFVADYDQPEQWLDGTQAFYARTEELQTPMGSRTAAVRSRERAEELLQQHGGGKVLTFEEAQREWGK
jgi:copper chaperone NosL